MNVASDWTYEEIRTWIHSQSGPDSWYQTIPVKYDLVTPGRTDSVRRMKQLSLPEDLSGMSVLDIGCNSGMLCFESIRRNAERVVGIDLRSNRIRQAQTIAAIKGLDITFYELDLFNAPSLGQFDIVFCISVVTEVTNLIGALEILQQLTRRQLYLELATLEACQRYPRLFGLDFDRILNLSLNDVLRVLRGRQVKTGRFGKAELRPVNSRQINCWALTPDKAFLQSVFGEMYVIEDLGLSVRHHLLKLTRKVDPNLWTENRGQ